MRSLIHRLCARLYLALFGLRVLNAEQHIGDLEAMLSELTESRNAIDEEIAHCTRQLLEAQTHRDRMAHQRGQWQRPAA